MKKNRWTRRFSDKILLCKVSSQVKERPPIFEHFQVLKNYLLFGKIASAKYFWNEEVEKATNFMDRDVFNYYRTVVDFCVFHSIMGRRFFNQCWQDLEHFVTVGSIWYRLAWWKNKTPSYVHLQKKLIKNLFGFICVCGEGWSPIEIFRWVICL